MRRGARRERDYRLGRRQGICSAYRGIDRRRPGLVLSTERRTVPTVLKSVLAAIGPLTNGCTGFEPSYVPPEKNWKVEERMRLRWRPISLPSSAFTGDMSATRALRQSGSWARPIRSGRNPALPEGTERLYQRSRLAAKR
jgi:hypothetical protein